MKINKVFSFLAIVLSILLVTRATLLSNYLLIDLPWALLHVALLLSIIAINLVIRARLKVEYLFLLLIGPFISVIANDIPEYFRAPERLVYFMITMFVVGPIYVNTSTLIFREKLLRNLIVYLGVVGSVLSVIWSILGLPNLGRGPFSGIFTHSMLLAPFSSVGLIYCIWHIVNYKHRRKVFIALALFCLYALLLSNSRVAMIGALVCSLIIFSVGMKLMQKVAVVTFCAPLLIIGLTYLVDNTSTFDFISNRGTLSNTREALWEDRLSEFSNSPIVGVGFASVDPLSQINNTTYDQDSQTGVVEPGSSYLAILSMTGIIGGLAMTIFLLQCLLDVSMP